MVAWRRSPEAEAAALALAEHAGSWRDAPFWVALHNGVFDSYDGGAPSSPELERIAEDESEETDLTEEVF